MAAADARPRPLLCVFAHPDDESLACGGLIAWCADLGIAVTVMCLTRGEHGPRGGRVPADAAPAALGAARAAELRAACRVLGVADVALLDYEDGMLPCADALQVEDDIAQVIDRVRPDAVITFDEDGLYWHPDHVAVHERTTEVVRRMGDQAPALYYVSLPAGAMAAVVGHAALAMTTPGGSAAAGPLQPIPGIGDAWAFGAGAPPPTLVLDVAARAARKLEALACHGTQVDGSALAHIGTADAARLLGREQYRRADIGRQGPTFLERLGVEP